jgi:hypothetical protein
MVHSRSLEIHGPGMHSLQSESLGWTPIPVRMIGSFPYNQGQDAGKHSDTRTFVLVPHPCCKKPLSSLNGVTGIPGAEQEPTKVQRSSKNLRNCPAPVPTPVSGDGSRKSNPQFAGSDHFPGAMSHPGNDGGRAHSERPGPGVPSSLFHSSRGRRKQGEHVTLLE